MLPQQLGQLDAVGGHGDAGHIDDAVDAGAGFIDNRTCGSTDHHSRDRALNVAGIAGSNRVGAIRANGVIRKVCRHFHILTRHRKGRLGGVVLVRGLQEGVCFLFLIAYLHRPADEVLSLRRNGCQVHGFTHRHSAAARYGRIAAVNVRRHMVADPQSGVQSGVARKVCRHFHILTRHRKGRLGGVVLVRGQEVVCFLTAYLHRPAGEALSLRHSGCQVHFGVCGHRDIQHFVLKLCGNILTGNHTVHRAHIAAGVAVRICCIGVNMGGFRHLFSRQTRAVCSSALPPVFGTVMFPLVIMPMHIQYDIHFFVVLSDIIIVAERLGIGINRKGIPIDCAATRSSCFACVKVSRQSGKVKLSITFNCNIIAAVLPLKLLQSRIVRCIQRRQICIRNIQILQILVRTYIQFRQICIRNIQILQLRVRTYIQYTQWVSSAA